MTTKERIDRASRVIAAPPEMLYRAFIDRNQLVQWLPPKGMSCKVHALQPVERGALSLSLYYDTVEGVGKTSDSEDALEGQFTELVPHRKIAYAVEFKSNDPDFSGTMTQVWTFDPTDGGTRATITCANVPAGISPEDHAAGMNSTLANLAAFAEPNDGER